MLYSSVVLCFLVPLPWPLNEVYGVMHVICPLLVLFFQLVGLQCFVSMNANISYLAVGEKESIPGFFGHSAPVLSLEASDICRLSRTRTHRHTLTVRLRSRWHCWCQNQITACPFHVWPGHAVPFSVRRKLKWLLTQEDNELTPPTWTLSPSFHYNTIHVAINIPHSSVAETEGGRGVNKWPELWKPQRRCHQTKMLRYTCWKMDAKQRGRALLRWHQGQPLNSCMGVPSVMEARKWRAIQGNTDRLTATRGGESSPV